MVEELVGNVGTVAFAGKESAELPGVLSVLRSFVPFELVERDLCSLISRFSVPGSHARDKVALHRLIDRRADHAPVDLCFLRQVAVADGDLLFLRLTVVVAPPER